MSKLGPAPVKSVRSCKFSRACLLQYRVDSSFSPHKQQNARFPSLQRDRKPGGTTLIDVKTPCSFAVNAGLRHAYAPLYGYWCLKSHIQHIGKTSHGTPRQVPDPPHKNLSAPSCPSVSTASECRVLSLKCLQLCTNPLRSLFIYGIIMQREQICQDNILQICDLFPPDYFSFCLTGIPGRRGKSALSLPENRAADQWET